MKNFILPLNASLLSATPARKRRLSRAVLLFTGAASMLGSAWAHDQHGLVGSHWHATDVLGFVAAGGALAVAIWLSRGGK